MATCTAGQKPFAAATGSFTGDTPEQVCAAWGLNQPSHDLEFVGQPMCVLRRTASPPERLTNAILQVCDPTAWHFSMEAATGLTQARMGDYLQMFWGFTLVLCTLWGLKKLINMFDRDHEPQ